MGFSVVINIDGVVHKMETMAECAMDLEVPLRRFGTYLRRKAIARYEAQDFAPLAQATLEARAAKGLRRLEVSLRKELKKALNKQNEMLPPESRSTLLHQLLGIEAPDDAETKGARNALAKYQEFRQRHHRHGNEKNGFMKMTGGAALSVKQLANLSGREGKYIANAVGAPILGKLVRSLVVEVSGGTMTLTSRTRLKWSEVHNEGGTAGRGSKIPQRQTLVLEEADKVVLAELVTDWLTHRAFGASAMIPGV